MVKAEKADLRWGVEQRLEFIEFRLFWEGHVNRGDLMDAFGVSVNQASTDLNRYIGMVPDNMVYDKSARAYIRGSNFDPMFLKPDASRYLSQLRSVADCILDQSDAWIGQLPSYDAAPTPVRGVDAKTLRSVMAAIQRSEAIEIKYQSLSRPEPRWRWIAPHAIGFDGFRWHTRAFCLTDRSFKDFLLSRIMETRSRKSSLSTTGCRTGEPKSQSARPCSTTRSSGLTLTLILLHDVPRINKSSFSIASSLASRARP